MPAYFILTNDDGIDAPGIKVLEDIARQLAPEVWVVAPEHDQSGSSQSISLHQPLRVFPRGLNRFAVTGTPADCVAMATGHLMQGKPADLLLSGINRGANIGNETVFSGTIGAAMTGLLCGIPSIALSQAFHDRAKVPWHIAELVAAETIRSLFTTAQNRQTCLNVNFPDVAPQQIQPLTVTSQGSGMLNGVQATEQHDPRTLPYFWLSLSRAEREEAPETEASALKRGAIAVTPLQFDRTCYHAADELRQILSATR